MNRRHPLTLGESLQQALESGSATEGPRVRLPEPATPSIIRPFLGSALEVHLPLPPSVNNLFVTMPGQKGRFKSKRYKAWIAAVGPIVTQLAPPKWNPFAISLTVYGGKGCNPLRDVDNIAKPAIDVLVAVEVIPGDSIRDGLHGVVIAYRKQDPNYQSYVEVRFTEEP